MNRRAMKTGHDAVDGLPSLSSSPNRRRDIRLDAPSRLRVIVPPGRARLVVRDISMGGLSILSPTPFAPGSVHTLRLTLGSLTVLQRARTAHCRRQQQVGWVIGLAFVGDPLAGGSTIDDLLDAVMSSMISFY